MKENVAWPLVILVVALFVVIGARGQRRMNTTAVGARAGAAVGIFGGALLGQFGGSFAEERMARSGTDGSP